ncbi:hypothetical protein Tco_0649228 [Tanacetum coccineum]
MSEFKQTNQFVEADSLIPGIVNNYLASKMKSEEHGQKVYDLEEHSHQEFNTGNDDVIHVRETLEDASQWNPLSSPNPDREWYKTKTVDKRPLQPWISKLAQATGTQSSFNYPTYDLIKGTCKSVVELEYHLEEVFKATNDQLDWHNPEGKPYPHDLSNPLPLIQNERGRQIIPWDYFINNDLEYLKGGSSSKTYTTSVTKTKAADYGQVKWIEDKVSRIWSLKKINLTRPDTYSSDLRRMTRYTAYPDIQGIIYEDEMKKNRLMRTDEFHKFSDGTLNHVRTALNDIATGIEMDYFPQRK